MNQHPTRRDGGHPTGQVNPRRADAALLADIDAADVPLVRLGHGEYTHDIVAGRAGNVLRRKAAAPVTCPYCHRLLTQTPAGPLRCHPCGWPTP